jgi:hypothetical protein
MGILSKQNLSPNGLEKMKISATERIEQATFLNTETLDPGKWPGKNSQIKNIIFSCASFS